MAKNIARMLSQRNNEICHVVSHSDVFLEVRTHLDISSVGGEKQTKTLNWFYIIQLCSTTRFIKSTLTYAFSFERRFACPLKKSTH